MEQRERKKMKYEKTDDWKWSGGMKGKGRFEKTKQGKIIEKEYRSEWKGREGLVRLQTQVP
jgi:hypothetical protein